MNIPDYKNGSYLYYECYCKQVNLVVTSEDSFFGFLTDSNYDILFEIDKFNWENFKNYFLQSFSFYILAIIYIFIAMALYFSHVKDSIDDMNGCEIQQRMTLLQIFFDNPTGSNSGIKLRNQVVFIRNCRFLSKK